MNCVNYKRAGLLGALVTAMAISGPIMAQSAGPDRDTLLTAAQWQQFNKNLIEAVHNESAGVREGALSQIVYYGDHMDFPELTVFEVMHIYRDHDNPAIKRLAVVALGNMGSRWAIEFLAMLAPYEKSESLRRTMEKVVSNGRAKA